MNHNNFNEKTSEEAPDGLNVSESVFWAQGYNTSLSSTNAAELLQRLIDLKDVLQYEHNFNKAKGWGKDWSKEITAIEDTIKKATDEQQ